MRGRGGAEDVGAGAEIASGLHDRHRLRGQLRLGPKVRVQIGKPAPTEAS